MNWIIGSDLMVVLFSKPNKMPMNIDTYKHFGYQNQQNLLSQTKNKYCGFILIRNKKEFLVCSHNHKEPEFLHSRKPKYDSTHTSVA